MGLETKLKFVSGVFVVSISVLLSAAKILVFYFEFFVCCCLLDWLMWLVKANLDGFL